MADTNNVLLKEFTQAFNKKRTEILELQTEYKLKEIQNEIIQRQFKEIRDNILNDNTFYADSSLTRLNIKKGDRITDSEFDWLLSQENLDKYQALCRPKFYEAGLTDKDGYYTKDSNTENELAQLKDKLIKLSVNILPNDFPNREVLIDAVNFKSYNSYNTREKLFELIMKVK
jgi:hypothetical protein